MAGAGATIKILLADDHLVVREVLRAMLAAEAGMEVVAEAQTVDEVRREVSEHKPDILVLDLNMPGGPSLDVIPDLREQVPGLKIIVLTMENSLAFSQRAMQAGAVGYILKDLATTELVAAIYEVTAGGTYTTRISS